ncbi:hypothetical protein LINGRAHAP2_LOCUS3614 [Linum grandiflorum]
MNSEPKPQLLQLLSPL